MTHATTQPRVHGNTQPRQCGDAGPREHGDGPATAGGLISTARALDMLADEWRERRRKDRAGNGPNGERSGS